VHARLARNGPMRSSSSVSARSSSMGKGLDFLPRAVNQPGGLIVDGAEAELPDPLHAMRVQAQSERAKWL
jgi:hypothetical protein